MANKIVESTRMNVPSFIPELVANASTPNGFWEASALESLNHTLRKRQEKNGANRWSFEVITDEPEWLHCDLTNDVQLCHFVRVDFWKDEVIAQEVKTIKDPTFDDIEVGDIATLRSGSKFVVKAALASPDDMIGDYVGLVHLDGLEPMSCVHNLRYFNEDVEDGMDIVELLRRPAGATVTTSQVFIEGCDLGDACEVLRTNGFEYEEGADYWFKKKPLSPLEEGCRYRITHVDEDDSHYGWETGDIVLVEESNEETSYCHNVEDLSITSWLGNEQLEKVIETMPIEPLEPRQLGYGPEGYSK